MIKRSITGLFIAAVFTGVVICSLIVHYLFFDVFVLACMLVAAFEVGRALKNKYAQPYFLAIYASIVVGCTAFYIINLIIWTEPILGTIAFLTLLILATLITLFFGRKEDEKSARIIATQTTLLYPCVLMVCMLSINYLAVPYRAIAIIMLFTVTPLTDMLAYLVGSTLKGKKLCPQISPKKTISGAIGGLVGGLIGGGLMIGLIMLPAFDWLKIGGLMGESEVVTIVNCLLLGLLGSVSTQAGDLLASFLKRKCNLKDYGKFLPGHGGIMDRIDGMIVNATFLFVYMSVISLIW